MTGSDVNLNHGTLLIAFAVVVSYKQESVRAMPAWPQILAPALRRVADALDGGSSASGVVPGGSLPADAVNGLAALAILVNGLAHGNASLSSAEDVIASILRLARDSGLEPPAVAAALDVLMWLAPMIHHAYAEGIVSGGIPAAFPPGGGPGPYRGR